MLLSKLAVISLTSTLYDLGVGGAGGAGTDSIIMILSLFLPLVLDFELLLVVLVTGETLLLCPLVVAGEGVWLD